MVGAARHKRDSHGDTPLQVAAHGVVRKVLVPLRSAVMQACAPAPASRMKGASAGGGDDQMTDMTQEGNEALRCVGACIALCTKHRRWRVQPWGCFGVIGDLTPTWLPHAHLVTWPQHFGRQRSRCQRAHRCGTACAVAPGDAARTGQGGQVPAECVSNAGRCRFQRLDAAARACTGWVSLVMHLAAWPGL